MSHPRLHPAALALVTFLSFAAWPVQAQTVTTGAIEGVVISADGRPLTRVDVTLIDRSTLWSPATRTGASGIFRSGAVAPGLYDVRAEALGFRPLLVLDVSVIAGSVISLDLRLTAAQPPVSAVDTLVFFEGAAHASLARGTWDRGLELTELVDPLGRLTSLGAFGSGWSGGLELAGLPDRLGVIGIDGVARAAAAHPGASRTDLSALEVPLLSLDHAEVAAEADVEWPGTGGGLLSAFSARGPRTAQTRVYGDASNGGFRGGMLLGGPVLRDTARVLVGIDARRVETRFDAPWVSDSVSNAAAAIALDSFATDLSGYLRPLTERTDVVTGFGRFDWEVASGHSVAIRASGANLTSSDFALGNDRAPGLGTALQARDIQGSAALKTRVSGRLQSQFSIAIDRSLRDYRRPSLPGTMLLVDGLFAGADGALPGRFERNATRLSGALLYRAGAHRLKVGFAYEKTEHDINYAAWSAGSYVFGSLSDFASRRGSFVQAVGGVPAAIFSARTLALYAQDSWSPARGLSILLGIRTEGETQTTNGLTPNAEWLRLTGMRNDSIQVPKRRTSPRFAFTWWVGPQREWQVRGQAGMFTERADPGVMAELISHDGTVRYRRGLGSLGAWPGEPDSTVAPVIGTDLTLLQPRNDPPRTARLGLGIARTLGRGTSFELSGQYRHTEFLMRRTDLNLQTATRFHDQDGRPVYGALQQFGAMLAPTPGSNRRYAGFDLVSGLEPTGFSDYWGVTASVERVRDNGVSFWASYTYSQTTDNWPGARGSVPELQLSPFPGDPPSADWRNGRSDLDVPHRATLGAEWSSGRHTGIRVGALLRYRSGAPFTPGFQGGVDANGDGAFGNDPAFVSDTVAGAAAIIAGQWCLRSQIGSIAVRNSCRAPGVLNLDARLAFHLFTLGGAPGDVYFDGLNLLGRDDAVIDRALYLVDPSRALTTNAVTGLVTVPRLANPNFGRLLERRTPGATLRAGIQLNF